MNRFTLLKSKRYAPLAKYSIVEINGVQFLQGTLEIPISVGVVGGAIRTHPSYTFSLSLLKNPSAKTLAQVFLIV